MDSSFYAFVDDLDEAEVPQALALGLTGLTVAAAYHQARDVTPHGRTRVTYRQDGIHFPPGDAFAGLRLTPPVQPGAKHEPLRRLRDQTAVLHGWGVFLHNTTLGLAHPDLTQENCFGERAAPADLCPAQPEVRAYAVALARAIASQGVDSVVAESLHYGTFRHGYHHERCFIELGEAAEYALGLCFCAACRAAIPDAAAAQDQARRLVDDVLTGGPPAADIPPLLRDYGQARTAIVTSLAAEVSQAVESEGAHLVFLDLTGAVKGFADGAPTGPAAAHDAWRIGVDPAAIGEVVPSYAVLAYARDPARIAHDIATYRVTLGDHVKLRAVVRPGRPDTDSAEHLASKLEQCVAAGADAIDFYHYDLVPRPILNRVPQALTALKNQAATTCD